MAKPRGGRIEGAGRPPGRKNNITLEREKMRAEYEQLALSNLRAVFRKQLLLAMGETYVYRKEKHGTGASMRIEHVLLEDPREIADALDIIANEDYQDEFGDNGFVYISTVKPEGRSIDSILDRSIGKPSQPISGDKDNPLEVVNIIKYAKPEK